MQLVTYKLRVLHFPQVPCKPFIVDVKDEFEAKKIMDVLVNQHCWLFENNIIPDYCNAIIVQMFEDNEWIDYDNAAEFMDWDEFEEKYLIDKVTV